MVVVRYYDTTKTQTVSVTTDILTNYSLVCNLAATLISPPIYVSLAGLTITVDPSLTFWFDVGLKTISVLVDSLDYPSDVVGVIYTFTIDVKSCSVTLPTIADTSYTLNSGPKILNFDAVTWNSLDCNFAAAYTA